MAYDIPLVSAARTASGDSANITVPRDADLRAELNVSARSGTSPTLDVLVQHSSDGGTSWITIGTFAQKTNTGSESLSIRRPTSGLLRIDYTIGGTSPSFTFSVTVRRE